jgi:hypothetical protein
MNQAQAVNLARKSDWEVYTYDPTNYWTLSFHKPDVAAIWVRFSPNGRLTKLDASNFLTGRHYGPTRDKGTRLSHYLTEGIV